MSLLYKLLIFIILLILSNSLLFGQFRDRQQKKETIDDPIYTPVQPFQLVWQDEFNGRFLNHSIWKTSYGNPQPWDRTLPRKECGTELQVYLDDNITIGKGTLKIIAKKEKYVYKGKYAQERLCANAQKGTPFSLDFDYTSGVIESNAKVIAFKYGRFEARCRIPRGAGLWPAFWLWGGGGISGRAGEIDIFELFDSSQPIFTTSIHNGNKKAREDMDIYWDITEWHTYSAEWEEATVKYFVDGVLIRVVDRFEKRDSTAINYPLSPGTYKRNPAFPWEQWMVLRLNLAVNPDIEKTVDETTPFPAVLEIDYVRVYERVAKGSQKVKMLKERLLYPLNINHKRFFFNKKDIYIFIKR